MIGSATKQSILSFCSGLLSLRGEMDCFAALAMTESCARNDGEVPPSLRGAQRRSNPAFRFVAQYWIASLRSQ
jgi:hypothetical protein